MTTKNSEPNEQDLARAFSGVLQEWLSWEEMQMVLARNEMAAYRGCCASHDFCDANMAMNEAFRRLGIPFEFGNDLHDTLWSAAWHLAKQNKFFINQKET